ncbi:MULTISPECIES: ABC transporter permease [Exiguobacterium]|uniref:ABC transporter permease subunit n=1 Tax=Exiguobacterium antarcticum TaxID=132920 RepID=A0ABT6R3V1_9BACL|nr:MULTISPECIES: ABC transporter permease [Exiguobacterium]AFS69830.1 ABC-2 type transporter [Exiguobacterium antarcticum B7]MCT4780958.1 ABC transporter permease [Exiguobacterium soli]MDI3235624.1 ABC transporter permease subunit [Exiguobacterium antarcticum]
MLSLIQNEWMKWWTMKKSKIVLALYLVIAVGLVIIAKTNDFDFTRSEYYTLVSTILFGLLGIITIVFTAETVGNEVRYDTMKHLLMSPYSRMTIYFSKLLFSILIMLGQFLFIALITYAASFAFSETGETLQLRDTVLALVNPIFTIFMTLFFSLVFRSVGMIIGFTVLAQFFTSIVGNVLLAFKPEIAKWIVFMHLDWSMYFKGALTYGMAEPMGTTLTFSIIFVIAHILVLFGSSILIFQKKSYL